MPTRITSLLKVGTAGEDNSAGEQVVRVENAPQGGSQYAKE